MDRELQLRPGRMADLYDLVQASIAMGLESEGLEADPQAVQAGIAEALQDPRKARYFVAEKEGQLIGSLFVTFEWSDWNHGWYWWIQGLYVDPEHRGQGVYSRLYRAVLDAAKEAGDVARIRLYVNKDNQEAIRAYQAHGMKRTDYRIFDAPVD